MAGIDDIVKTLENVQNGAEGLKCVLENEGE